MVGLVGRGVSTRKCGIETISKTWQMGKTKYPGGCFVNMYLAMHGIKLVLDIDDMSRRGHGRDFPFKV